MTDAEWLACADPEPMLESLRGTAGSRRMRLFAVACCRHIAHLVAHEESRRAIEVGERYADGLAGEEERRAAYAAAESVCTYPDEDLTDPESIASSSAEAALSTVFGDDDYPPIPTYATTCAIAAARASAGVLSVVAGRASGGDEAYEAGLEELSVLAREIFGNPFRPVELDRARLTPGIIALARSIYDERTFDRMPTLGDALEEAGCTDAVLLAHCRASNGHVRGCWVLDAILGRA